MPHRAPVLFEILRRSGQEELERPLAVAVVVRASSPADDRLLGAGAGDAARWLPRGRWTPLVAQLGYSVGFVIVILSRQQLFTENVITAVVPVMAKSHMKNLLLMLRLWAVVLVANVAGAICFAPSCSSRARSTRRSRSRSTRSAERVLERDADGDDGAAR